MEHKTTGPGHQPWPCGFHTSLGPCKRGISVQVYDIMVITMHIRLTEIGGSIITMAD